MTPVEYFDAINVFAKTIGPEAEIFTSISNNRRYGKDHDGVISAAIYTRGIAASRFAIEIFADDFETVLARAKDRWAEHAAEHRRQTVRKMALEIIRITADIGACSEAALRITFSAEHIALYGAEACADANEMAGKGPFAIVRMASNGAPEDAGAEAQAS